MKLIKLSTAFCSFFLCFFSPSVAAQPWMEPNNSDTVPNFFKIQNAFYQHWAGKTPGKGEGWKPFKRWEWFWEQRVNPDGSFPAAGQTGKAWQNYVIKHPQTEKESATKWKSMGPNVSNTGYTGIGRINAIAFHPTLPGTIWVGTPAGGLWKTTNGGSNWVPLTDQLTSMGVSAIVLDPANPDIMYIGTGDGDSYDTYSTGVLKSMDGGATWTTTGLNWTLSQGRVIRAMLINPANPNIMIVGASNGIYQTINGGTTWSQKLSGTGSSTHDLEFKPGDPNTVYAASADKIRRSTDGGATWAIVATIPTCNRIALTVSPADPTFVGALCSSSATSAFQGFYASVNSGQTFTQRSSAPNILGSRADGTSTTGQGSYDLCTAASPTSANVIYIGGINIWKSTDGGVTWTIATYWANQSGLQTVHADHHTMSFRGNTLFIGCDGGIYSTTNGTAFSYLSGNLAISQIYRVSCAQTDNAVLIGLQDNGTKLRNNNSVWSDETGGDGMQCRIDPANALQMYSSIQNGSTIYRSVNGGVSWNNIAGPLPDTGAWITPFLINPSNNNQLFAGYRDLWRSNDKGTTWTKVSTNLSTSYLRYLVMSASSSRVLYAATTSTIWRTGDGGASWKNITTGLPTSSLSRIAVHPADSNTVYATYSTFSGGKIYKSTNGGTTWTNFSGTLPALPANCAAVHTDGAVYIGMDIGVFYRTPNSTDWVAYKEDLPNAPVMDLDIKTNTKKLRAATYGRGLWENDLVEGPAPCAAVPPGTATFLTPRVARISWPAIPGIGDYLVQIRPVGDTTWSNFTADTNSLGLVYMRPCTPYEWRVAATCAGASTYNAVATFTTTGCGSYCSNYGYDPDPPQDEWIERIQIGNLDHVSGPDWGYNDFTNKKVTVEKGQSYPFALTPGFEDDAFEEVWSIWIDYNQDNTFSDNEKVFESVAPGTDTVETGTITIPPIAMVGTTRMRISISFDDPSPACGQYEFGESEDYAVEIKCTATPAASIAASGPTALCPGQTLTLTAANVCSGCTVTWSNQQTGASITVAAPDNYTATVSGTCGTSPVSNTVSVTATNATPAASIAASGPTALCPGQTVTLTAANVCSGCTVTWSNQQTGASITVAVPGDYAATVSGTCGTSPVSNTVSVTTTLFNPFISAVGCNLTAPLGASYEWLLNGNPIAGETKQTHVATQTGQYSVRMVSIEGCRNTSPAIVLNCVVDTEEPAFQRVQLLPNPNTGNFYLVMPGLLPDAVMVTDIAGREMLRVSQPAEGQLYQLGRVPSGVYLVTIWWKGHVRSLLCMVVEE